MVECESAIGFPDHASTVLRFDLRPAVLGATLSLFSAACATVPAVQQAFLLGDDGLAVGRPMPCGGGAVTALPAGTDPVPLLGPDVRVLT